VNKIKANIFIFKRSLLILMVILCVYSYQAQKKVDTNKLKQKEKELQKKIENTKNLIKLTRNSEQLTIAEIAILNNQIAYREQLLANITFQMRKLEEEIEATKLQIIQIENSLNVLKAEYIKMLQYAYKTRHNEYDILYILSSESYSEAYYRMKYIEQYADYRIKQVEKIKQTQALLNTKIEELNKTKEEKKIVAENQEKEKENYVKDKDTQQQTLTKLKQNEQSLKAQLVEAEKQKAKIANDIKKAIEAAILEEKKKAEAEAKKKAEAAAKNPKNTTTTKVTTPPKNVSLTETPESQALSKTFALNKGKLPWPVEKGEVTSSYGRRSHPEFAGLEIDEKGIGITTLKGATVRAVFDGEVSSVLVFSGAGKVVIISHGSYKSVYGNLQEVFVSKGDKVKTKQSIGKLMPSDNGTVSEAHLEIWKTVGSVPSTENPALWIFK
jgi:septal ring factor EnvC (AmiA/AmiB activator)